MPRIKMDAVKVGLIIQKGDLSKLRGKSFEMCDNMKKKKELHPGDNAVGKPTLSQRMDRMEKRFDRLETTITDLAEEMRAGFKQVNTRLDYIVKANDLKDLSRSK